LIFTAARRRRTDRRLDVGRALVSGKMADGRRVQFPGAESSKRTAYRGQIRARRHAAGDLLRV
jgi:hypothetical protein